MSLKWVAKAVVQKIISYFPQKEKVNYFFQKHITKAVHLTDEHLFFKLNHAKDHLYFFEKYATGIKDKEVLELGSGWYPIIPICFYLNNVKKIISIDIQSWMTKETQLITIKKLKSLNDTGELQKFLPNINHERWEKLEAIYNSPDEYTKEDINKILNLELIIKDARKTELDSNCIDFICSNNTFEHIDKKILVDIIKEFKRVLKNEGVMSHFIDMSDHFAHFDKKINIYNFLKFSNKKWNIIDNSIQPQNRLRYRDYTKIYSDLNIPITQEKIETGDVELLKKMKISTQFKDYSIEELAISHAYIVSKLNASSSF